MLVKLRDARTAIGPGPFALGHVKLELVGRSGALRGAVQAIAHVPIHSLGAVAVGADDRAACRTGGTDDLELLGIEAERPVVAVVVVD